jgi:acetylornithine aminotransferase
VRGEGVYVWDADGQRYLDLLGGIATNVLGYADPAWCQRLAEQAGTVAHVSNHFASIPQIELAEKLLDLVGAGPDGRVFFSNSGTESVEAAVKIALKTGRRRILALEGSFHGRTLGALSVTSKAAFREPFEPLGPQVQFLPFGDTAALSQAMGDDVAAVIVEVVQGEAGVLPLPPDYLPQARRLADRAGALLIVDEVQTGMGHTGTWFAHQNPALVSERVVPDVVTLAKALGGGFPIGATLALTPKAATLLQPGEHGTTFGGNPLACAAALATIEQVEARGLIGNAVATGQAIRDQIAALGDPRIQGVRGAGLLLAVVLAQPWAQILSEVALEAGVIVNAVAPDALRLAPAYILTPAQVAEFTAILPQLLDQTAARVKLQAMMAGIDRLGGNVPPSIGQVAHPVAAPPAPDPESVADAVASPAAGDVADAVAEPVPAPPAPPAPEPEPQADPEVPAEMKPAQHPEPPAPSQAA